VRSALLNPNWDKGNKTRKPKKIRGVGEGWGLRYGLGAAMREANTKSASGGNERGHDGREKTGFGPH